MPHYLVGFMNPMGQFGTSEIHLKLPIRGMKDVKVIAELLAKTYGPNVAVMGFSRFEEEDQ